MNEFSPPLQPFAEPLPPYSLDELRGDLHHLIQPLIGNLRLDNRAAPDREREHTIDRLYLALALVDVAAGETTIQDYDVRMGRTRHGTGFFRNESGEVRAQIQALYMAAKQTDDPAHTDGAS